MQALQTRLLRPATLGDLVGGARSTSSGSTRWRRELRQPLFAHFVVGWRCTFAQIEGRLEEAERLAVESL